VRRLPSRIARALQLDADLFEEVEHDHGAGGQAVIVVLLASFCGGAGNMAAAALLGGETAGAATLAILAAAFLVAWLAWSFATMAVGTMLFGGRADMGEMQRALGFAAAPGLLMLVPGLGAIVSIPWSLVAMVIAVRQACDFTTRRALATVAVATIVMLVVVLPPFAVLASRL
jgi:hypothetical protein